MYFYTTLHKLIRMNFEIGVNVRFFFSIIKALMLVLLAFFIYYLGHHMHMCIKINNSKVIIYNQ